MASSSRIQLERWLKTIDVKAGHVIDFGGDQKSIIGRVKSWEVKSYESLDLPTWDLNKEWFFPDEAHEHLADVGFCLEVSEYLWNPVQAIKNIRKCMKREGTLYMSFHFIYPQHAPIGTDYLRYTPDGVNRILREGGFSVYSVVPRKIMGEYEPMLTFRAEEMHAVEGVDHSVIGSLVKAVAL